jgi:hypothetical protein
MNTKLICDTLRETYNTNLFDLDENKIIGEEFSKVSKIHRDTKKGDKILMDLIYNHYNVKKPFPAFIGGPQTLTMHWSNKWKKIIYIFGEHHSNTIDCEKRFEESNPKKWVSIENFLEELILKTDVYLDIYFEFPAIQKTERRYYDSFKPFPTDYRLDILFKRFKKYIQPGTKNGDDCSKLVRVHYFDSRVEDHEGKRVGVGDVNWFELKTFEFTKLNLPYRLKELLKDTRFNSVLKSLSSKDDELFIEFWMKQYKENKYNADALLNCPLQAEILKFIEDELRLELKTDNFVKLRSMLIKYIPHILSDTLEDDSIVPIFEFIIQSITVPKAFIADVYTLASIFKDVTEQPTKKNSIIIYGGNAHCETYRKFLKSISFEEFIIAGKPSASDEKATCVNMKKLDKPFFSDWSLIADPTHHKSLYLRKISESKTYTEYLNNLISYLQRKPELTDLWMVIGATNHNDSDLSRFHQEYDITISGFQKVNINEPNLLSLYSNDEHLKKFTKDTLYKESGSRNIYELLVNSLTIKERFSKIIYDLSTTKDILDNDQIFNELVVIKDLIALNGKLYIDNFRQNVTKFIYLKKEGYNGNYYLKDERDTVTPKTLNKYVGYNTGITIKVYEHPFPTFCNPEVLFTYMNDDGSIPSTIIDEHILNIEHYHYIEKTIHHTETMRRLSIIFPFPQYKIEYIENGKYPNNPSILITEFYLITKKLEKPLKAAYFGCTLPRSDKIHGGEEGKRQLILLDTLKRFEEASADDFRYHRLAFDNLARWSADVKKSPGNCVVMVLPGDWGNVTHDLTKKYGVCFASLNMANAYGPGGGYTDGMIAQEENMFRRTDCHFALVRKTFMKSDGSESYTDEHSDLLNGVHGRVYLDIENPRICIRGQEDKKALDLGYKLLADEEVFPFYELRAAAVDLRSGEPYDHKETCKRVAAQLETLIEAGVRHVVLSAFGCGAFMNPANKVATAYHEALKERHMHFDVVAFAIFSAGYGPNNFKPFEDEFAKWK